MKACAVRPHRFSVKNKTLFKLENKAKAPLSCHNCILHSFISTKLKNLQTGAKFTAASCTVSLTLFLWLSQLSKPSAVCFPLTFSPCAQTLSEVLLTEPGLWEWADSQHWLEISSSNWISRRGGSHYPYMEVGNEKNTPAISQYSLNSTTSSHQ